jgi:hypothetical protein
VLILLRGNQMGGLLVIELNGDQIILLVSVPFALGAISTWIALQVHPFKRRF